MLRKSTRKDPVDQTHDEDYWIKWEIERPQNYKIHK